ncbi:MAG: helicase-related protein, partial [Staphylococcus sp.]|nr:helicase-related protein [Staphylococcus sp.]
TGGGKTEAYLAVSAFSALYRRVKDKNDVGVDTFMRYTLRLLTVDQFQRAARLIISLEYIRRRKVDMLGEKEYSIGLWVGGDTTPNNFEQAKKQFNEIIKNKKKKKFIVTSCPWCGAEIKPIKLEKNTIYQGISIESTLKCSCPDEKCEFENKLPIYFIDEDIYENPPTFLIGTIDKFVQLTWKPKARSLFGINKKGERIVSPPNLIIQDELHLISGPLGSLTGMYETLIEELTYDYRSESKPKILGATATIKAFNTQIKALFGREKSFIFPPSGISMDDNFFSNVILNEDGTYFPGRKYIGIYPITQGKLQTQVQTFSKLLMTVNNLPIESKNSFWTILSFYNTIKDIGKANSLVDQDIPYTINYNYDKSNIPLDSRRYINREKVKELTSRMNNNEIAGALQELKTDYTITKNEAIDLALASNIIEVGVDIDRLSLMTIVGQPKTTSQYIQVSGRIGRKVDENPGLVIVLYNKGNSTDKSHYEHFNEYHQQLYANVEETSITPFSYFSIERGLPAVLIGFLRQIFDYKKLGIAPNAEFINDNLNKIEDFVEKRIVKKMKLVDTTEKETLQTVYEKVLDNLTGIDYESWESKFNQSGYMVQLNEDTVVQEDQSTIITSMRNVDATSRLKVKNKRKHNYKNFF